MGMTVRTILIIYYSLATIPFITLLRLEGILRSRTWE
jgi:hypothetical protein